MQLLIRNMHFVINHQCMQQTNATGQLCSIGIPLLAFFLRKRMLLAEASEMITYTMVKTIS